MKNDRKRLITLSQTFPTVLLLSLLARIAYGQQERTGFELFDEASTKSTRPSPTSVIQPRGVALESTVDPQKYYVGPSDVFSVNIWLSPPLNFTLTVTPEGTLIVPTVGEVAVSDMTLSEAKKQVITEIKKKYISGNATVTLMIPRPIIVTVSGNVLNQGLYELSSIDRVDKAIGEANKPTRVQSQGDVLRVLGDMSTRNIVLKHKDATTSRIDIGKFLATKEDKWNPYLREGDLVIVPRKNFVKNVIGIYGEVNVPGRYEFVPGDSIKDAILLAQGFTRLAIRDSAEFSRLDVDGNKTTIRIIDANNLFEGKITDVPLQPGDRIIVRGRVDLREDYRATVSGEVLYPGTYPITKNKTRLSQLIKAAGSFTEFADLKRAELNRRSVGAGEIELERLLSSRGGVSGEDSLYYFTETELRLRKEIVNVDFEKLFLLADSTNDVLLQSEDYVFIPSVKRTIYVFGQVVSPGHVPYVSGENVTYYLQKAGGVTDDARSGDLKIIKSKTKQWLSENETTIEEGDYVWVPKKISRPFVYYTTIVSHFASILSAIVGIAIVVATVSK